MATSTRFRSPIIVGRNGQANPVSHTVYFAIDVTSAVEVAVVPAVTLPKGAIVDCIIMDASSTGGTNPTILLGDTTNTNGLLDNFPTDDGETVVQFGRATVIGSEFDNTPLPRDYTLVHLGGSGTDATGGVMSCHLMYHMDHNTADAITDSSSE